MFIGICGKPNSGKSTFFSSATLIDAKIAPFPFTTIEPNMGKAYVRTKSPAPGLGVTPTPHNYAYAEGDGVSLIPIDLMDVAGLVPDAHLGKGLGLKFLDDLRGADAIIQVVDASGKTDAEGRQCEKYDPCEEVVFLENEMEHWIAGIISRGWSKVKHKNVDELAVLLSGLKVTQAHVEEAAKKLGLDTERINWSDEQIFDFSKSIRAISKPILIAANKIDIDGAMENVKRMSEQFPERIIVPCSAEAELALRKASAKGIISYVPGSKSFEVRGGDDKQKAALERIRLLVEGFGGTGVQEAVNRTASELLNLIVAYPVEDENKFTDKKGRVLPDAYFIRRGSGARELAGLVHTDLAKNFITAVDAKTKMKIGKEHALNDGDVVKIVAGR